MSQDALTHRNKAPNPLLVGKTLTPSQQALSDEGSNATDADSEPELVDTLAPLFKSAQWSPDGTTILASREDNTTQCFILPPDLLNGTDPHILEPYAIHQSPSPVYATAIYPKYELSEISSTLFIASPASLPIRLLSPFAPGILGSYPFVNQTTEAYIAPHSLLFGDQARSPETFFAGSSCQISAFNITRDGEGPVQEMQTIPSRRRKIVGGGVGMKGIVSTLSLSHEGLLAAGTFTRWIGLYDGDGRGGTVGVFQLGQDPDDADSVGEGSGITQLQWSPCGRYLYVAERSSDGIGIWDIRGTGKRLAWLQGRNADTMQRLGFDVVGQEVWAGGTDGYVRVWEDIGALEGTVHPSHSFPLHQNAVSSATMHPFANVLATSSGKRRNTKRSYLARTDSSESDTDSTDSDDEERVGATESPIVSGASSNSACDDGTFDNTLKIWSL